MTTVSQASGAGSAPFCSASKPVASRTAAKAAFRASQSYECSWLSVGSRAPFALVCGVRRRALEHADQREGGRCEQRASERHRAVTGIALVPEVPSQIHPEEDEEERDERCEEETRDLVLAAVVRPVRERLVDPRLAARIAPRQREPRDQQQTGEDTRQWLEPLEARARHRVTFSPGRALPALS